MELRFEILKVIGKHYPIGLPFSNHQFAGYQNLLNIIKEKVDTLITNGRIEPWFQLVNDVESKFPVFNIDDMAYANYPCLSLVITFKHFEDEIMKRNRAINVFLSLLGPYYTIFFTERFDSVLPIAKENGIPKRTVWYTGSASTVEEGILITTDSIIRQYYPDYKHVDYHTLLSMKVYGAIPHGEDLESETISNPAFKHNAFDYLFMPHLGGNESVIGY